MKEKVGSNDGDGDRNGYENGEARNIPTDDLSLEVEDVRDPLGGMPNYRVELVSSMSSRKYVCYMDLFPPT